MPDLPSPLTCCPLCGESNACAMAVPGAPPGAPCWCRSAVFSADLLAWVPDAQRGQVCICAKCAAAASPGDRSEEG